MIIQMDSLGRNGRFANQAFQFFFLKLVQQKFGCEIRYPYWLGLDIFNLTPSPPVIQTETRVAFEELSGRGDSPDSDLMRLGKLLQLCPGNIIDISGYFQYHTNSLAGCRNLFLETFSISDALRNEVFQGIKHHNIDLENLIVVHFRAGDYLSYDGHPHFWAPKIDSVIKAINNFGLGKNATIYLASDDMTYVEAELKTRGVNVISCHSVFKHLSEVDALCIDFTVMTMAAYLMIANSTFSFLAAMLNSNSKLMTRPASIDGGYLKFEPWSDEILLSSG